MFDSYKVCGRVILKGNVPAKDKSML